MMPPVPDPLSSLETFWDADPPPVPPDALPAWFPPEWR